MEVPPIMVPTAPPDTLIPWLEFPSGETPSAAVPIKFPLICVLVAEATEMP